jgi:hypothetical protein
MNAGELLARQFPCKIFPDVEKSGLGFRKLFFVFVQIGFLKINPLTEEIHTFFCSKNFYFLHFSVFGKLWQEFPDVEKLALGFRATFFVFDANPVFENARLNRGIPYLFFFKKLLLFTFFELLNGGKIFPDVEKWGLGFPRTFFAFHANRVFGFCILNRGNPYDFSFKKLFIFTFFELLQWRGFPDVEKLGLGFLATFFRFHANRVFKIDRLNRGNPYLFFFKKLFIFTFFCIF